MAGLRLSKQELELIESAFRHTPNDAIVEDRVDYPLFVARLDGSLLDLLPSLSLSHTHTHTRLIIPHSVTVVTHCSRCVLPLCPSCLLVSPLM